MENINLKLRYKIKIGFLFMALMIFAALTGCAEQKGNKFKTNFDTVHPSTSVTMRGNKISLYSGSFQKGMILENNSLSNGELKYFSLKPNGKVRLLSIVPSLDTPVCDAQTHLLGETKMLHKDVERVTISRDLPMAQKRFAQKTGFDQVVFLSDYKTGGFGKETGLMLEGLELLSRSVIVLDKEGKIHYYQIVPELTNLPDMEKAFSVANDLVGK
jgi:thiol peroxidase